MRSHNFALHVKVCEMHFSYAIPMRVQFSNITYTCRLSHIPLLYGGAEKTMLSFSMSTIKTTLYLYENEKRRKLIMLLRASTYATFSLAKWRKLQAIDNLKRYLTYGNKVVYRLFLNY